MCALSGPVSASEPDPTASLFSTYRQAAQRRQANEPHCRVMDVQPLRGSHSCLVTHPLSPGSFSPQWLIQLVSPSPLSGSNNGPASSILKGCHTRGCLLHTQHLDLPLRGPLSFDHAPSPTSLGTHLFSQNSDSAIVSCLSETLSCPQLSPPSRPGFSRVVHMAETQTSQC